MQKNFGIFDSHLYRTEEIETFIFGIDPGVTTGLSVIGFKGDPPMPQDIELWGSDQISYGGSGNVKDLYEGEQRFVEQRISQRIVLAINELWRENPQADIHVVIEDFIIRRVDSSRDFLSPVRLTSGIMQELLPFLTYEERPIKVWFQSPSNAKGTCTDERMDKWGYQISTKRDRHSRDADRHAVLLLRKMIENPKLRSTKL